MIYLARKGKRVVAHADRQAMLDLDGVTPEKEITDAEWEAAGGLARVIGGEIIVGQLDAEKAEQAKQEKIAEYKAQLEKIDHDTGAGRAFRAVAVDFGRLVKMLHDTNPDLAEFDPVQNEDLARIVDFETEATAIREQLKPLLTI